MEQRRRLLALTDDPRRKSITATDNSGLAVCSRVEENVTTELGYTRNYINDLRGTQFKLAILKSNGQFLPATWKRT